MGAAGLLARLRSPSILGLHLVADKDCWSSARKYSAWIKSRTNISGSSTSIRRNAGLAHLLRSSTAHSLNPNLGNEPFCSTFGGAKFAIRTVPDQEGSASLRTTRAGNSHSPSLSSVCQLSTCSVLSEHIEPRPTTDDSRPVKTLSVDQHSA